MSITPQFSILVACCDAAKLTEYSGEGVKLREISLQKCIVNPFHAVQLSSGQFVVCHGGRDDTIHRVCLVDASGFLLQSYGTEKGSAVDNLLNGPCRLAVDNNDFIFVVDAWNRRVLILNPNLSVVCDMIVTPEGIPRRLYLEADSRRLFLGINQVDDVTKTHDLGSVCVYSF